MGMLQMTKPRDELRVLWYTPSIDVAAGGVSSCLQQVAAHLGRLVQLHVVTHRSANMLPMDNCTLHFLTGSQLFPWASKRAFVRLLAEVAPDVVHTNSCWEPMNSYSLLWAHSRGYKTIYTLHGMMEPFIMRRHYWMRKVPALAVYQGRALRAADRVVATSAHERDNFLALGYNSKVAVIPNCIQLDGISLKTDWAVKRKILYLSRLHPVKGIERMLEAVATLRSALADYRVVIVGSGEPAYVASLQAMTHRLGIAHLVDFKGNVTGPAKWALYRSADFLVLPTNTENFGMVVVESLAVGTPVITTKGAPWEELVTQACGLWVDISTAAIAHAMETMIGKTATQLEQMGRNGRALVERRYAAPHVAEMMVDMYTRVIDP